MFSNCVDIRSDTVTKPTPKMRKAMAESLVGDDVFDDDPTVLKLQSFCQDRFNKPAALFFPTGTQASLCALLCHCQRGDEYICGQTSHQYLAEGGGGAVLGSINPQPLENNEDGTIDLNAIQQAIKPDDIHFAKTTLISLENTIHGQPITIDYIAQVKSIASKHKLKFHLDGARIFNAAIALNCDPKEIIDYFDSATICLSKGLGAPAGTILLGSPAFIKEAKRWRKVCGGGMRQVGILAAAALIALEDSPALLLEDHHKAQQFCDLLKQNKNLNAKAKTNMVFCDFTADQLPKINKALQENNVLALINLHSRFVFHKDVPIDAVPKLANIILKSL